MFCKSVNGKSQIILITFALVLCQSGIFAQEITLQFWNGFTGPDGKNLQRIVDAFNDEYKGQINVNMVVMSWDDYYSKLALALRTKRAPDVGIVHYDNVCSVIYQGIALELDSYLDRFPKDDFFNLAWEISRQDGHQYGIPLDFIPLVFFWNKDIFAKVGLDPEKPPSNREEFLETCKLIKETNFDKKIWPTMVPSTWPHFLIWQDVFFCNGGRMFNEDFTKATYDSFAGRDALQFLWDLIYKYEYSPANIMGVPVNEAKESFRRQNCAMLLEGIWMLTSFQETPGLNFGAVAAINLGVAEHKVCVSSHTMIIFKKRYPDALKTEAAVTFLEFISNHSYLWASTNLIPARRSIIKSEKFKSIPYLSQIASEVDKFTYPVSHYRSTEGV